MSCSGEKVPRCIGFDLQGEPWCQNHACQDPLSLKLAIHGGLVSASTSSQFLVKTVYRLHVISIVQLTGESSADDGLRARMGRLTLIGGQKLGACLMIANQ